MAERGQAEEHGQRAHQTGKRAEAALRAGPQRLVVRRQAAEEEEPPHRQQHQTQKRAACHEIELDAGRQARLAFSNVRLNSRVHSMNLRAVKPQHETRTRILDAAEELFMQHGFEGTSMRLLTAKAGVNLAAVNYHFGSKDALIEALFRRRLDPMNAARIAELERLEKEAHEGGA